MQYYLHVVLLGISSSMLEMLNVLQSEMICPRTSLLVNINSASSVILSHVTVYYNYYQRL